VVDAPDLGVRQVEIAGARVLFGVRRTGRLGDTEERGAAHHEAEGNLTRGGAVRFGNLGQHAAARRARVRKAPVPQRRVRHHRHGGDRLGLRRLLALLRLRRVLHLDALVLGAIGIVTSSTPFAKVAFACWGSTPSGSGIAREKTP
jgi:hypothetical protein